MSWIKIDRKIMQWEWFAKPEMVQLFLYLLLKANTEDRRWQGMEVKRGQLVTSVATIQKELGLTRQKTRTCIERLISTNEITTKSTNRFMVITICNYGKYQNVASETNQQNNQTANHQATIKQPQLKNIRSKEEEKETTLTCSKESGAESFPGQKSEQGGKVEGGVKEEPKPSKPAARSVTISLKPPKKRRYAPEVLLTEAEHSKLVADYGADGAEWMIRKLDNYKAARGMTYKSDYRAILNWVAGEWQRQNRRQQQANATNATNGYANDNPTTNDQQPTAIYGTAQDHRADSFQPRRPTERELAKAQRDAEFAQYIARKLAGGDGVP